MPVGNQYQVGPVKVGPFYPENLPFGIGQAFAGAKDNSWTTQDLTDSAALQGLMHPWPLYRPGTTEQTPFGEHWNAAGEAMAVPLQSLWEGTKQLGNYFGVGGGQAPMEAPPAAPPASTPAPVSDPMTASLMEALSGGRTTTMKGGKVPGPTDYSGVLQALDAARPGELAGPDFTTARDLYSSATPTKDNLISDQDKMAYILNGLSQAGLGVADSDDLGEILFALGMGSLGGWGQHKAAMKGDERIFEEQMREFNLQRAGFEGDAALQAARTAEGNEDRRQRYELGRAETQAGIARDQSDYSRMMFDLTSPKVTGDRMISSKVGEDGNVEYSITPLGDPDLLQKMQFMSLAGGPNVNVASSIIGGQLPPGVDPEMASQMRSSLMQKYQELLSSEEVQDALMNMSLGGQIDIKGPEATLYVMQLLDSQIQQNDPQAYYEMLNGLQMQQMFRGLAGGRAW